MIKLIDVTYYTNEEHSDLLQLVHHQRESLGYLDFIKERLDIQIVKHLNYEGNQVLDNVKFTFFKGRNKFFYIPFRTNKYIKAQKPDILLVQGLIFPVQIICLRLMVGKKCKIVVQHHAERPFAGIKRIFQKVADYCIDGYLFTAIGNAEEWKACNVIQPEQHCYEVLEGATFLQPQNKTESKALTGMTGANDFLWVGRLEANKDPLTILLGFERYASENCDARLYMIYQEDDLLAEVRDIIDRSPVLSNTVKLVGKVKHETLGWWFSAADFYLSGSHRECAGFALIESMTCGCIPIVTDIPPFRKIVGGHGFLFEPGNPESLCKALEKTNKVIKEDASAAIVRYAQQELSFEAIADSIFKIADELVSE